MQPWRPCAGESGQAHWARPSWQRYCNRRQGLQEGATRMPASSDVAAALRCCTPGPQAVPRRSLGAACHAQLGAGQPSHTAGRHLGAECRERSNVGSGCRGTALMWRFEAAAPQLYLTCHAMAKLAALPMQRYCATPHTPPPNISSSTKICMALLPIHAFNSNTALHVHYIVHMGYCGRAGITVSIARQHQMATEAHMRAVLASFAAGVLFSHLGRSAGGCNPRLAARVEWWRHHSSAFRAMLAVAPCSPGNCCCCCCC